MVPGPVHVAASGRRMKVLQRKNRPDSEESGGSPYASSCLCADPAGRTLDVRLASSGIFLYLYAGEKGKVKPFLRTSSLQSRPICCLINLISNSFGQNFPVTNKRSPSAS
jgi:hypothetical protein